MPPCSGTAPGAAKVTDIFEYWHFASYCSATKIVASLSWTTPEKKGLTKNLLKQNLSHYFIRFVVGIKQLVWIRREIHPRPTVVILILFKIDGIFIVEIAKKQHRNHTN